MSHVVSWKLLSIIDHSTCTECSTAVDYCYYCFHAFWLCTCLVFPSHLQSSFQSIFPHLQSHSIYKSSTSASAVAEGKNKQTPKHITQLERQNKVIYKQPAWYVYRLYTLLSSALKDNLPPDLRPGSWFLSTPLRSGRYVNSKQQIIPPQTHRYTPAHNTVFTILITYLSVLFP